ncbi:MAG: hypothetical protein ACMXX6_01120 [Candidatus Woesearchaeota archaeon]
MKRLLLATLTTLLTLPSVSANSGLPIPDFLTQFIKLVWSGSVTSVYQRFILFLGVFIIFYAVLNIGKNPFSKEQTKRGGISLTLALVLAAITTLSMNDDLVGAIFTMYSGLFGFILLVGPLAYLLYFVYVEIEGGNKGGHLIRALLLLIVSGFLTSREFFSVFKFLENVDAVDYILLVGLIVFILGIIEIFKAFGAKGAGDVDDNKPWGSWPEKSGSEEKKPFFSSFLGGKTDKEKEAEKSDEVVKEYTNKNKKATKKLDSGIKEEAEKIKELDKEIKDISETKKKIEDTKKTSDPEIKKKKIDNIIEEIKGHIKKFSDINTKYQNKISEIFRTEYKDIRADTKTFNDNVNKTINIIDEKIDELRLIYKNTHDKKAYDLIEKLYALHELYKGLKENSITDNLILDYNKIKDIALRNKEALTGRIAYLNKILNNIQSENVDNLNLDGLYIELSNIQNSYEKDSEHTKSFLANVDYVIKTFEKRTPEIMNALIKEKNAVLKEYRNFIKKYSEEHKKGMEESKTKKQHIQQEIINKLTSYQKNVPTKKQLKDDIIKIRKELENNKDIDIAKKINYSILNLVENLPDSNNQEGDIVKVINEFGKLMNKYFNSNNIENISKDIESKHSETKDKNSEAINSIIALINYSEKTDFKSFRHTYEELTRSITIDNLKQELNNYLINYIKPDYESDKKELDKDHNKKLVKLKEKYKL